MNIKKILSVQSADNAHHINVFSCLLPLPSEIPLRRRHAVEHFNGLEMLSAVLGEFYGIKHIRMRRDEQGKPQLIHPFLHCNISHCKGLAVCAVGNQPIGVDCEPPRTVRESVLSRVCTPSEQQEIMHSNDVDATFSKYWTLKEAYGKWHGGGIRLPLQEIPFSINETGIHFLHPNADEFVFYQQIRFFRDIPYAISVCTKKMNTPTIICDSTLISNE